MIRNFISIPSGEVPYALFSYTALVPWTFFTNALSFCGPSIALNANIIKKISVPREVFPLAAVTTALFDFFMAGTILAGMMLWYQVPIGWSILWVPVLLLLTTILAFGVGLFIASLGTLRRDFILATPFIVQFWLYATPVIYPLSAVPERWRTLYMLNPMVGIIVGFRGIFLDNSAPSWQLLGSTILTTVIIFLFTWPLFRWLSRYFADVV